MMNHFPKRPIVGGTNKGLRPLQYDYWRVGYGSAESFALEFWIERAGEFRSKQGFYSASDENHPYSSQFYFHLDGQALIDANGQETAVMTGDLLAMPVGVPFQYSCQGILRYHWFAIPDFWPSLLGQGDKVHWLAWGYDSELEARFSEIREILILGKPGYSLRAIGVFYELIARVMERSRPDEQTDTAYPDAVRNAITYLRENYRIPFDASLTAASVGLSQSHLRALFEKWVGESPQKFHTRCRIDEAKRLLMQGNLTVAQVGHELGYTDAHYFSRVFKRVTGIPPSQFASN